MYDPATQAFKNQIFKDRYDNRRKLAEIKAGRLPIELLADTERRLADCEALIKVDFLTPLT
ncbi:MAG: hypothetical protein WDN29_10735 [Methylovirgula sp.]